jgi:hypothetical protein
MSLISLLVVLLLGGLLLLRHLGGSPLSPSRAPQPAPTRQLERLERSVDAAGRADQQRLDDAMKGLR